MSRHLHQIVVVTGHPNAVQEARRAAEEIFSSKPLAVCHGCLTTAASLVGPAGPGYVNDFDSFMIHPDGSKLGWPEAEYAAAARAEFMDWLDAYRSRPRLHYVCVQYGGDDGLRAMIQRSSDEPEKEPT